ncbi:MAG: type II toxin-antitoxin system PemK/MazF family toxin [Bacteroidales bacterium]|nr:type II toxin-antitoxin system PemK/MazF family toxin [Bacteroidales bacterium]
MKYKKGDIVIIGFPFSDLTKIKKRPALIISNEIVNKTGDYLMVQITSKLHNDQLSLEMNRGDFLGEKELPLESWIRLHKIFLLNESLIISKNTAVTAGFLDKFIERITKLIE